MIRYVAFLRAINVGGRMVKMEDLKKILTMPGIKNVATYIQSGNVVFDSVETHPEALVKKIEIKLRKSLGFEVKALLRSIPDMEAIVKRVPFKEYGEDMALHVTFLSAPADKELSKQLLELQTEFEQFRVINTEIYFLLRKGGYGETKFSNTFLEKKLKVSATTRNWATVNKMLEPKSRRLLNKMPLTR